MKTKKAKRKIYQVQWLHNGQWRIELNNIGDFPTKEAAQKATQSRAYKNVQTRIVEVVR